MCICCWRVHKIFSSKSVRVGIFLSHSCSDVFLLRWPLNGAHMPNVLNYYGYNEQPNGMLSRQNYVTFDFDDSSSILMGFSHSSASYFVTALWLFLMEQKFMTANNPKIEYTIHVPYTNTTWCNKENGNKMTLVVIWNWKFSSSMHSYGSYRSTRGFTMLFSRFPLFGFRHHSFHTFFSSSFHLISIFSYFLIFIIWKMNPMGFHATSCDVSMFTEKRNNTFQ